MLFIEKEWRTPSWRLETATMFMRAAIQKRGGFHILMSAYLFLFLNIILFCCSLAFSLIYCFFSKPSLTWRRELEYHQGPRRILASGDAKAGVRNGWRIQEERSKKHRKDWSEGDSQANRRRISWCVQVLPAGKVQIESLQRVFSLLPPSPYLPLSPLSLFHLVNC